MMVLYTTTQAATHLGISKQAVHDAYKAGRLKAACFVPNRYRREPAPMFDETELERYAAKVGRKASA